MRSRNAFFNLIFSLLHMVVMIVVGFVVPRYIIMTYGSEINGLTATITRILSVVSLIQAGACGTAIYHMYKPVANDDYEIQSAILYSSRKYYIKVCWVYALVVGCCGLFYAQQLQSDKIGYWDIVIAFLILALSGMLNFYFLSRYDIFLSPHQKQYLLRIASVIGVIVQYTIVFWALLHGWNFKWIYGATLIGTAITLVIDKFFYEKESSGIIVDDPRDKKHDISGRNYLMFSCISNDIVNIMPPIIITAFCGLTQTSVFAIYSIIYTVMLTLLKTLQLSVSAIFGNVVNTESDERIADVFNVLVYMFTVLGTFLASCTAFLFLPFMKLYTIGFSDADYLQPELALLLVLLVAITALKECYGSLCNVFGMFKFTCKLTFGAAVFGVVVSTLAVYRFGMPYVAVGMITSAVLSMVVICLYLKTKISWVNFTKFGQRVIILFLIPFVSWKVGLGFGCVARTFEEWTVAALLVALVNLIVVFIYSVLFERQELVGLYDRVFAICRRM